MKKVNEKNMSKKAGGYVDATYKCDSCGELTMLLIYGQKCQWSPARPEDGTIDDGCDSRSGKICPHCKNGILVQQ